MLARSVLPALLVLLPLHSSLEAATRRQMELVQPVESRRGTLLLSSEDRASVESEGRVQRVPLRRGELLTAIAETSSGWLALGTRSTERGTELLLLRQQGGRIASLPLPRSAAATLTLRPVPLIQAGHLLGLAWLEGPDLRRLSVRAAAWEGARWGRTRIVSRPGRGSQSGLAGAILEDGSWLLVWSRHDGQDDEIYWSQRLDGLWDRPRRLEENNRDPDIAPALLATPEGALLTWSRRQGDEYRVLLSRFRVGRWEAPYEVAGPGSVFATLHRQGERSFLIHRRAMPLGWGILELGAEGAILGQTEVERGEPERPALIDLAGSALELRWAAGGRSRLERSPRP